MSLPGGSRGQEEAGEGQTLGLRQKGLGGWLWWEVQGVPRAQGLLKAWVLLRAWALLRAWGPEDGRVGP